MAVLPGATSTPVLVADDEEFVRAGIESILSKNSHEWAIVGETSTVEDTYRIALATEPAIAVVDQCLPGGQSLHRGEGVPELCRDLTDMGIGVIVFTESGGTLLNRYFQRSGAVATVARNHALSVLRHAVESVARGKNFYAPSDSAVPDENGFQGLTPRQAEIIRLLALGRSNPEIAQECGMSVRTVESHRARIRRQIGADSLSELTRFALDHGLVC